MIARYHIVNEDGSNTFSDYPLRDCTEEDLAHFYPFSDAASTSLNLWENQLQMKIKDTL